MNHLKEYENSSILTIPDSLLITDKIAFRIEIIHEK